MVPQFAKKIASWCAIFFKKDSKFFQNFRSFSNVAWRREFILLQIDDKKMCNQILNPIFCLFSSQTIAEGFLPKKKFDFRKKFVIWACVISMASVPLPARQ
jgi:hypothetical protein